MKKLILVSSLFMLIGMTSCHKDECPTPTPTPISTPNRIDSLEGVWVKYLTMEYRSDTLYQSNVSTNTQCVLSLSTNETSPGVMQAVESFTYCQPSVTSWNLVDNGNQLYIDTIQNGYPIGHYFIEKLTSDTLVIFQNGTFNPGNYRIKFVLTR